MHRAGENILMLAPAMEGDAGFDRACGYPVVRFSRSRKGDLFKIVCAKARSLKADYLLCTHWKGGLGLNVLAASKILGVPYFIIAYGSEVTRVLKSPIKAGIRRLIYKSARKVYCISSYTGSRLMKMGVHGDAIQIAPCGIDMEKVGRWRDEHREWQPAGIENMNLAGRKIIFTLARLEQRKGVDKVLESLSLIARDVQNFVYLIGGDGPYRADLESMAQALGVKDRVVFLGRLTDDEKYFFYKRCDIFVMASRDLADGETEGFGIVFLEANAFGKPVVGGLSGGVADAVADGETGLLVKPDEPADIAGAIVKILKDTSLASRMGEAGRKRNIETMNWNIHTVRMVNNIHESIGKQ